MDRPILERLFLQDFYHLDIILNTIEIECREEERKIEEDFDRIIRLRNATNLTFRDNLKELENKQGFIMILKETINRLRDG